MRLLEVLSAALLSTRSNLASSAHQHQNHRYDASSTDEPVHHHYHRDSFQDVVISLRPADRHLLESTLADLSDPDGEKYGRFLSREEARALLQPRQSSVDAVKRWLAEAGVPEEDVRDGGQVIEARVSTSDAERLLRLEGLVDGEKESTAALRAHVAFVHRAPEVRSTSTPQKRFPARRTASETSQSMLTARREPPSTTPSCGGKVTPASLRALYHMDDYTNGNGFAPSQLPAHARSRLGIAGFSGQAAQYAQLDKFLAALMPDAVGANFSTALYEHSGEANLDIQYAVGMAYPVPVTYYAVGGEDHDFTPDLDIWDPDTQWVEPYDIFFSYLLDLDDEALPRVVSISYGVNEQDVPRAHAQRICDMIGQLGTRGVSVIASSGDQGPGVSCLSNDGTNTTKFLPAFPASCPYVTSVGGTHGHGPEVAWNLSSGGFSEYWPRPAWQEMAVGEYLARLGG
ncbi:hypothetical protein ACCO45_000250 [Purpureocillium lilacinum]|uniref:Uncharacterized protein n=1 Tax=Purpureocillium lilacinum TaxID=33203 RepID=A0ACC4E453_PURLI